MCFPVSAGRLFIRQLYVLMIYVNNKKSTVIQGRLSLISLTAAMEERNAILEADELKCAGYQ
jgi:hypothetical protein